jgi:hypothetical protein
LFCAVGSHVVFVLMSAGKREHTNDRNLCRDGRCARTSENTVTCSLHCPAKQQTRKYLDVS